MNGRYEGVKRIVKWFRKQGDSQKQIFDRCIHCHHVRLYQHALWMTGSADNAADMVQETYFQAWRSIENLREEDKAFPWLLTILRRAVYREQRCVYRDRDTLDYLQEIDELGKEDHKYGQVELYQLLEGLTPTLRETFLLSALHGFSYQEISDQLCVPMGTVMSRISRAREELRSKADQTNNNILKLSVVRSGEK